MNGTVVLHGLHVLFGLTWLGGLVIWSVVVWPGLLRRPAPEAKAALMALGPRTGLLMMLAGQGVIWSGVLRGTVWGPVQSWEALFHTGYGQRFLAALTITAIIVAFGGWVRSRLGGRLWQGEGYRAGGARFVHVTNGVILAGALAILICMVGMRFGG